MREGTLVDEALALAAYDAILAHKRAGVRMAVWKNGQVEEVEPDELLRRWRGSPPARA